jgi:soluble lytic murein transglycosylase
VVPERGDRSDAGGGLIRQESAFEPEAHSSANAFGLMQLLPTTARRLAKQANIRYAHARLVDPDYNVRLGTIYVAGLQKQFGNVESALAAYNAGEDRVASWTAGQNYREPAEFVESIPFTETRQYVQIVTRNADIYRRLYGADNESRKSRSRGAR